MSTRTPVSIDGVVPWPADDARRYREAGYWSGRSLGSHIAEQVDLHPDAEALVDGSIRLTYRQLWDRSASMGQALLNLDVEPGDRIVLQLPNSWEFVALTLGCFRIGAVPVMALPAHRRHELTHLAALSDAVAIVVADTDKDTDLRSTAQEVAAEVPSVRAVLVHGDLSSGENTSTPEFSLADASTTIPSFSDADYDPAGEDVACFLLSGGTTGLPKLIVRTHDDYAYNIIRCNAISEITSDTVYLGALPSSHNFPLACPGILGTLFAGGRTVMLPSARPDRALLAIDSESVTVATVVPAVAQSWIEYQREHGTLTGSSLKVLQVGGSRMPDELAARVEPVLGARLQQVFGMAEGLINMTRLNDDLEVITNTQGRPVSEADEIAVVDELGEPVDDGTPGALLTRGPYTPRGYFRAPEHNSRAFTADGWYASGDIVIRRPDGNLVVAGRDKDMINRGGEKISAEEVENFAYQVDGIEMAAAVAMPDPVLGERLCLYVSVAAGAHVTLDDVLAVMNSAGVARFKLPERLVIVDAIPTTKVGKLDKKAMREDIRTRLDADQEGNL
ncbi:MULTISPECIES: (2,3-dihydroxybenzoyl)adenylate synthase [unclassified Rhodococcus (in: high G+C Gram-positive bacteria)]|uniref:(2,3-dihydroxybenzoyl)adenylate synthase n=1 Tax=unclassified Rhodococcus (in: high G+C Gram-positive bacteria) TaxID=192944 RepID=UPI000B9A281A|nr:MULTISPECIES: AMP-binding protein [unclassified Rhodococcus (in: high G+C Gram-positive bacteria)]OZE31259.1 2,3-dihydroxybenzoate-AMP ligase [Rhodococcus sp. 05-2254-4]OZE41831.1 2,3-dihydroxybenzoate-AMP ligase [Rhodococcus sp. 05-2254-3]OZE52266.1 2,3-dihydroxybenzoate-AMP ligase [Rhodococcus sp. 05-2254-2]